MRVRRRISLPITAAAVPLLLGLGAGTAAAHGSMTSPISRVLECYQENPEHPTSAACRAAVAASGTAGFYDWMAVRQGNAAGQSRSVVPDGHLCSGGNAEFAGLDLPRVDWPATRLPTSGTYTFTFRATAPHKGTFALYVTKPGWNPAIPLTWSSLEATPFYQATDPQLVNGSYRMTAQLPQGRSGRALIYMVWQRSDSPEAFYSCSDVVFGSSASGNPAPALSPTTPPSMPADMPGMTGTGTGNSSTRSAAVTASPTAPGRTLADTGTQSGATLIATALGLALAACGAFTLHVVRRGRGTHRS